mmetsp:Transcript_29410/g.44536  ORF Transcript_29410/g.44536 Transcript_29410/m.44536 type:complete len:502 (-) Transcript_29410:4326-5831(-)
MEVQESSQNSTQKNETPSKQRHMKGAVRHAEKRRTGTCKFSDRIASISLECYRQKVPSSFRDVQKQTCVSCIVAHFGSDGHLEVQSLGVGTKFLPEQLLNKERDDDGSIYKGVDDSSFSGYGCRVRDCHAEVLARRAFCRKLCHDIYSLRHEPSRKRNILELCDSSTKVKLRPDVTLHMYSSSAPCGNATLKKFATLRKEKFNSTLGTNEWPSLDHEIISPHSTHLGQFSLLLKKDQNVREVAWRKVYQKRCPANETDDWCPPGTTSVFTNQGSIHTCSDKICRWNYLGLQGSLLASVFETPLYMSSLTVGRKFSSIICRRAVCCRAVKRKNKRTNCHTNTHDAGDFPIKCGASTARRYSLNHPSIMGTGVYMDDAGVLEMCCKTEVGQDVRFVSPLCWAWWPNLGEKAECIDGNSGFAVGVADDETKGTQIVSRVSTVSLINMICCEIIEKKPKLPLTLKSIHALKCEISPAHESAKLCLFNENITFQDWRCRFGQIKDN